MSSTLVFLWILWPQYSDLKTFWVTWCALCFPSFSFMQYIIARLNSWKGKWFISLSRHIAIPQQMACFSWRQYPKCDSSTFRNLHWALIANVIHDHFVPKQFSLWLAIAFCYDLMLFFIKKQIQNSKLLQMHCFNGIIAFPNQQQMLSLQTYKFWHENKFIVFINQIL